MINLSEEYFKEIHYELYNIEISLYSFLKHINDQDLKKYVGNNEAKLLNDLVKAFNKYNKLENKNNEK